MRAHLEGLDPRLRWTCERELRDGARGRRAHLPDGVVTLAGPRTAIEVELTPKSEERVRDVIRELLSEYDRVLYYATPRAARVVRTAASWRSEHRVLVRPYPLVEDDETIWSAVEDHLVGDHLLDPERPVGALVVDPPAGRDHGAGMELPPGNGERLAKEGPPEDDQEVEEAPRRPRRRWGARRQALDEVVAPGGPGRGGGLSVLT